AAKFFDRSKLVGRDSTRIPRGSVVFHDDVGSGRLASLEDASQPSRIAGSPPKNDTNTPFVRSLQNVRISKPLNLASSKTVIKVTTIWPPLSATAVNSLTTALFLPPAAATMSKLLSTWLPLICTLKSRWPVLPQ